MESLQSKHKAEVHCHYTKPVSGNVSLSSNCQDNSPHRDTSEPISGSSTRRSLPSKPPPPSIKRVPSQTGLNMMPRPELPMPIVTDPSIQWLPPTTHTTTHPTSTTPNTLPYKFPPSSSLSPAYAAFPVSPPMLGTGAVSQFGMQAANFANTIAQITEQNVIGQFQMHYAHAQSQWELAERKCKDLEKRVATLQRAKAEEKGRLEKENIELRKRLAALAGHAESSDSPGGSSTQLLPLGESVGPPEPGNSKQWRSEVEEILMLKQTISKLEHSHAATIAQQRSNLRAARKVVEDRLHHAEQRIIELEASLAEAQASHTAMGDEQLSEDTVQINSPVKQEEGVASVPPGATAENRQMSRILQAAQKQKDELRAMLTQEQEKSAAERTRLLHLIEELRGHNTKLQETVRQNQARSEIALEISHERLERMKEEKSLCEAALREEKASRASLEQTLTTLLHGLENNVCLKRKADSDTETEPGESQDGGCSNEKKRQLGMRDVKRARTDLTDGNEQVYEPYPLARQSSTRTLS